MKSEYKIIYLHHRAAVPLDPNPIENLSSDSVCILTSNLNIE